MTRDLPARHPASAGLLGRFPLWILVTVGTVVLAISATVAIGIGPVSIPPGPVARIVWGHLTGGGGEGPEDFIVWQLRVPRVVESVAVGAGLAVAGVVIQALVRNPLADPYVVGVSSGASLGAVLVLTTVGATAAGRVTLPLAAFAGAMVAGVVVFALAWKQGRLRAGRLIMVGVAAGHLLGGMTSFVILRAESGDAAQQAMFWILGSLSGAEWSLATTSSSIIVVLLTGLHLRSGRLNLIALGDDGAAALGMRAGTARAWFFVAVALLVGTAVAVSGAIGFVGLVVPNLSRLLVGADHRRVMPLSTVLGALLVLWADTGARMALSPTELPIGILTALVGVPVFIVAIRHSGAASGEL